MCSLCCSMAAMTKVSKKSVEYVLLTVAVGQLIDGQKDTLTMPKLYPFDFAWGNKNEVFKSKTYFNYQYLTYR